MKLGLQPATKELFKKEIYSRQNQYAEMCFKEYCLSFLLYCHTNNTF